MNYLFELELSSIFLRRASVKEVEGFTLLRSFATDAILLSLSSSKVKV